jgi:hypothetical protein
MFGQVPAILLGIEFDVDWCHVSTD